MSDVINLEGDPKEIFRIMDDFKREVDSMPKDSLKNNLFSEEVEDEFGLNEVSETSISQEPEDKKEPENNSIFDSDDSPEDYDSSNDSSENIGSFIPPEIVIEGGSILIATLISISLKFAGKSVNKKQMLLDASEKKAIKKPLEEWLKTLKYEDVSPLNQLLAMIGIIYLGKLAPLVMDSSSNSSKPSIPKKDGRGRPRLSEDEKARRKAERELEKQKKQ